MVTLLAASGNDYKWWKGDKTDFNKEGVLKGLSAFKRWLKQTPMEESFKYREGDIVGYMWDGSMVQQLQSVFIK
jgi:hypothetical protein